MGYTEDELKAVRRSLHQIPEIGLEEHETQAFLLAEIAKMPQTFLTVKTWKTAIIVHVQGSNPTKTIGWRTDIDALPIQEVTGLPFASRVPGRMHACGHDFHMTIALGVLALFSKQQPQENLTILFQPAEENEAGGMLVYESGALAEWLPDEFYALHVNPDLPVGTVGTSVGTLFAGTCEIQAHFTGKSGHAAYPHQAGDMIVAASAFVQQVQTIVSRNVNPVEGAVVTIGTFEAGSATNVIAGEAHLSGTIRTLTQEMNRLTQERIKAIAAGIATSYACQVDIVLDQKGYLPVENNPALTQQFITFMEAYPGVNFQEIGSAMTGEDFGYLLSKVPGTMFWLGVDSPYGLHHEAFNPKEEALAIGVNAVTAFLKKRTKTN